MTETTEIKEELTWESCRRVRLVGQPLGLGGVMTTGGGFLSYHMIKAYSFSEPWWLQLGNVLLIVGFLFMLYLGICNLLTLFHTVWVRDGEIQLRIGSLVLFRLPEERIASIRSTNQLVTVRNKDIDLYRLRVCWNGKLHRSFWIDWSVSNEEMLREHLKNTLFML